MSTRLLCLRVRIYDAELDAFPLVELSFYGGTREQCQRWHDVHLRSNALMREAYARSTYAGNACVVKRAFVTADGRELHADLGAVEE